MNQEAFKHLPHLSDKVIPPDQSRLRITPEVLAAWDAFARDQGLGPDWRLSDQEMALSRRAVLADLGDGEDLWIFAYGSLLWDPGFRFEEVRLADLEGFQRRFSIKIDIGRGSPERPALMLSLEHGSGRCKGLAFRISSKRVDYESAIIWRREMVQGQYRPLLLPVTTPQGVIDALVFGPNSAHPQHIGELPIDETAAIIATGVGVLGTNREYLESLVAHFDEFEIEERYHRDLLDKVLAICPS